MLRHAGKLSDSRSARNSARGRARSAPPRPPPAPSYRPPPISLTLRQQFMEEWRCDVMAGSFLALDKYEMQAEALKRWKDVLSGLETAAVSVTRPWPWHTAPVRQGAARFPTILQVGDSVALPGLKGAFIVPDAGAHGVAARVRAETPLAPYSGYIMTEEQFALCPVSVSTAVEAPYLSFPQLDFLIVGDPTQPSAQANHCAWSKRNSQFGWSVKDSMTRPEYKRQVLVKAGTVYDDHLFLKAHKSLAEGNETMLYYGSRFWSAAEPACAICLVKRCIAPTECNKQQRCAACTIEFISCAHRGCKVGYHLDCLPQCSAVTAHTDLAAGACAGVLCPFHNDSKEKVLSSEQLQDVESSAAEPRDEPSRFSRLVRRHSSVIAAPREFSRSRAEEPPATPERPVPSSFVDSPTVNFSSYSTSQLSRNIPRHAPVHSTIAPATRSLNSHRVTRSDRKGAPSTEVKGVLDGCASVHPLHGARNAEHLQRLYAERVVPALQTKADPLPLLQRLTDYEVRVVPELVQLGHKVQLGVYIVAHRSSPIDAGQKICFYGGLHHGGNWFDSPQAKECGLPYLKSHSLHIPSSDDVFDGRPVAEMYRRPPAPKTNADVRRVLQLQPAQLLPAQSGPSATDMDRAALEEFQLDPQGHMINCAGRGGTFNARISWIRCGPDGLIQLPVVTASRVIQPGEQVILDTYRQSQKSQGVEMQSLHPGTAAASQPRGAAAPPVGHASATPPPDFSKLSVARIAAFLPASAYTPRPLLGQLHGTAVSRASTAARPGKSAVHIAKRVPAAAVGAAPLHGTFDSCAAVSSLLNQHACEKPSSIPASSLAAASASATTAVASVQRQEAAMSAAAAFCPGPAAESSEGDDYADVDMTGSAGGDTSNSDSDATADDDFAELDSAQGPGRARAAAAVTIAVEKEKQKDILKSILRNAQAAEIKLLHQFRTLHKHRKLWMPKPVGPDSVGAKHVSRHGHSGSRDHIKPPSSISVSAITKHLSDEQLDAWWEYEKLFIPSARIWSLFPLWQEMGKCCLHPEGQPQAQVDAVIFQGLHVRTFLGFCLKYLELAHVQSNAVRQNQRRKFLRDVVADKKCSELKYSQSQETRKHVKLATIGSVPMCVSCTYKMYNVGEKTFKRDQDMARMFEGPVPKVPRPRLQRDRAAEAVDAALGDAEHAPHLRNTVHLPGISQRGALIRHLQGDFSADEKKPSASTIERAIKEAGVNIKTTDRTTLGKCSTCVGYDSVLQNPASAKDQIATNKLLRQQHLAQQRGQRHASFRFGAEAQLNDSNSWRLGIDGMDQCKTNVPHPLRVTKQEIKALTVKVMGVHIEGGPIPAMAYLCPEEVSGNANLTCEVVQRALLLSFNEEIKQAEEQGRAPRFPKHLRLSMDNATSSNKNFTFFNYLALLVNQGVFESVHIVFYLPGHGHCKLDQMFSRFSYRLSTHPAFTMEQLAAELRNAYQPTAKTHEQALRALAELDAIATPQNEMAMVDLHCPNHGDDDIAGCLFTTRNQRALQQHADECCYLTPLCRMEERMDELKQREQEGRVARAATAAAAAGAPNAAAAGQNDAPVAPGVPPLYTEVVTTVAEVGAWLSPQMKTKWSGITKCYEYLFTNLVGHGTVLETRRMRVEMAEVPLNERQMETREGLAPIVLLPEGYVVKGDPRVTPPCDVKDLTPPSSHKSAPPTASAAEQVERAFQGLALSPLGRSFLLIQHDPDSAPTDVEEKDDKSLKWHAVYGHQWPLDGHDLWQKYFKGLCQRKIQCPICATLRGDVARADQSHKSEDAKSKTMKKQIREVGKGKSGRQSKGAAAAASTAAQESIGAAASVVVDVAAAELEPAEPAAAAAATAVPRGEDLLRQYNRVISLKVAHDKALAALKRHINECKHPSTNFANGWWWQDEAKCITYLLRPSEVREQQLKRRPAPEALRQALAAVTRPAGPLITVREVRPTAVESVTVAAGQGGASASTAAAIEAGMFATAYATDTSTPFAVGLVLHVFNNGKLTIRWYEPAIGVDEQSNFNAAAIRHFFPARVTALPPARAPPPPPPAPPGVPAPPLEDSDAVLVRLNCNALSRGAHVLTTVVWGALVRGALALRALAPAPRPLMGEQLLARETLARESPILPPPPPPLPPDVCAPGEDSDDHADAHAEARSVNPWPNASLAGAAFPLLKKERDFTGRGFVLDYSVSGHDPLPQLVLALHGSIVQQLSAGCVLVLSSAELGTSALNPPVASQRARDMAQLGAAAAAASSSSPMQDRRARAMQLGCEIWSHDRLLGHARALAATGAGVADVQLIIQDQAGLYRASTTTYPHVEHNGKLVPSHPRIDWDAPGSGSPFESAGVSLSRRAHDREAGGQAPARLFCEHCQVHVESLQSHVNNPEHQRRFDADQTRVSDIINQIERDRIMCRIMEQVVAEDAKADEQLAAENAAAAAVAADSADTNKTAADSEPPSPTCNSDCTSPCRVPAPLREHSSAASDSSHHSTASASVHVEPAAAVGVDQPAGIMMEGGGGFASSDVGGAPQTPEEEAAMLQHALLASTQGVQSGRRLRSHDRAAAEERELHAAITESLTFPLPREITPTEKASVDSALDVYLQGFNLVEVEVPGDGDCLMNSSILACGSANVPLRERLSRLKVDVPDGELITASHLRRGIAQWIRDNTELFGLLTADPHLRRRGMVRFGAAAASAADGGAAAASSSSTTVRLVPQWLDLEQTLAELEQPGAWHIRYIEPCEPPADDPSLVNQTDLFDYLPAVLPFVLGARVHLLCKVALLGLGADRMAAVLADEGQRGHIVMDPLVQLRSYYPDAAEQHAQEQRFFLPQGPYLPDIVLIQQPEENHYHYAAVKATAGGAAAGSRAAAAQPGGASTGGACGRSAHNALVFEGQSATVEPRAGSAATVGAAAALLPFSAVVEALFSYEIDADSPPALRVKVDCMQQNGPLLVQLLVASATVTVSTIHPPSRSPEPYNTSVHPDEDCYSQPVWQLQQELLFKVLMTGVTSITWMGPDGVLVVHQPLALRDPRFRRVQQDALGVAQRRAASNAPPSLNHLVHADGVIFADVQGPHALSFLRLVHKNAAAFKAVLSKAKSDGSLKSFTVTRSGTACKLTKSTATEVSVRNEIMRLTADSASASVPGMRHSGIGQASSSAQGCFFTTLSAPADSSEEHGCAVEIMRDVMADAVAQNAVAHLENQPQGAAPAPTAQLDFDSVYTVPPAGFGASQVQLYGKTIATSTALHDEIADSSALNYATLSSRGVSVWIGVNLRHVVESVEPGQARDKLLASFVKLMDNDRGAGYYHALLRLLFNHNIHPHIVFQLPGESVVSPSGQGAAHAVLGVGSHMLNLAINLSTSPQACDGITQFYRNHSAVAHNSGRATKRVFSGMWLKDIKKWPLQDEFWAQQLAAGEAIIAVARDRCVTTDGVSVYTRKFDRSEEEHRPNHELKFCGDECVPAGGVNRDACQPVRGCGNEVLWKSINNLCLACFYHKHSLMQCPPHAAGLYPHAKPSAFRVGFRPVQLLHALDISMYKIDASPGAASISRSSSSSSAHELRTPPPPPPVPPPVPPPPSPPRSDPAIAATPVSSTWCSMSKLCTRLLRSCCVSIGASRSEPSPLESQRLPLCRRTTKHFCNLTYVINGFKGGALNCNYNSSNFTLNITAQFNALISHGI